MLAKKPGSVTTADTLPIIRAYKAGEEAVGKTLA